MISFKGANYCVLNYCLFSLKVQIYPLPPRQIIFFILFEVTWCFYLKMCKVLLGLIMFIIMLFFLLVTIIWGKKCVLSPHFILCFKLFFVPCFVFIIINLVSTVLCSTVDELKICCMSLDANSPIWNFCGFFLSTKNGFTDLQNWPPYLSNSWRIRCPLCLSTCLLKTMHCRVGTCRLPTQCVHVRVAFHRKKNKSCNLSNTNCTVWWQKSRM